jgi:peptidoglycan/LPS O-acetylase OafA/YrhL
MEPVATGLALPGGFTGVDVFFVMSGFLITSRLMDDIDEGRFSLLSFYDRRIRRIVPALIAMLVTTLIADIDDDA